MNAGGNDEDRRPDVTAPGAPRPALHQSAAWLNVAAKFGSAGVTFLLYIVLARTLTPEAFADVAVILAWLAIGAAIACFSAPLVLIRYVPDDLLHGRAGLVRGVINVAFGSTGIFALAIGAIAAVVVAGGFVALPRDLPLAALLGATLLLPNVLLLNLTGLLSALKRAAIAEILINVVRPAAMVGCLAAMWVWHRAPLPAHTALGVYLAASVLMLAVCAVYAYRVIPVEVRQARAVYSTREWLHAGSSFLVVVIAATISERIDILMMSFTATPEEVATYAVAVRFAQTAIVAAAAAATVMAPHLVERLADLRAGRRDELHRILRATARTSFSVSLAALGGFALLGTLFLQLFGTHYQHAYVPLLLLAAGQLLCAISGPAASVAMLAGRPRIAIVAVLAGIGVNVSLNVLLVPRFGAVGAAIATACGMNVAALVAWVWTRQHFGLDTSILARMLPARRGST